MLNADSQHLTLFFFPNVPGFSQCVLLKKNVNRFRKTHRAHTSNQGTPYSHVSKYFYLVLLLVLGC